MDGPAIINHQPHNRQLLCGFLTLAETALEMLLQLLDVALVVTTNLLERLSQLLIALRVPQVLVVSFKSFRFLVNDGDQVKGEIVEREIACHSILLFC